MFILRYLLIMLISIFLFIACESSTVQQPSNENNYNSGSINQQSELFLSSGKQITPVIGSVPEPLESENILAENFSDGLIRVAILLPLSGSSSDIGESILNTALMALFDVADSRFVLQPYDTQGTPSGAMLAAKQAISQGAQLFLGPVFSGSAKAVAIEAKPAGIKMIPFTTDPTVAEEGIYVIGFLVHEQIRRIINFSFEQGINRFAVLAPATPYGETVVDAAAQVIQSNGASLNRIAYFEPSGSNLNNVVRQFADYDERHERLLSQKQQLSEKNDTISQVALQRLEQLDTLGDVPFDAVLIPEQGGRLAEVAALLPFYDIDPSRVQLLGTMLWHTPGLGKEPSLVGGWYPAPSPEANSNFYSRYAKLFGINPPAIASLGYDSLALSAILTRTGRKNPFLETSLSSPSGFSGVDGIFRLLPNGLSERGFAVMEIAKEGPVTISPAPKTFEAE